MLQNTPITFAKMLGVPVIHASHAGNFETFRPPVETNLEGRSFLGETQIVDGHGQVLAHLSREAGDGVILAEITPGRVEGELMPIPEGFWIPDMHPILLSEWERLNQHGQEYYQQVTLPYRQRKVIE
jgi:hypothetical protein